MAFVFPALAAGVQSLSPSVRPVFTVRFTRLFLYLVPATQPSSRLFLALNFTSHATTLGFAYEEKNRPNGHKDGDWRPAWRGYRSLGYWNFVCGH